MRITRRIVPLVVGVTAAVGIAGVAALALPGITATPPVVEDEVVTTAEAQAVTTDATPKSDPEPNKVVSEPKIDVAKVAKARDSFPDVPKEVRLAKEAKQAERVAAKKAAEQAAKEKAAKEKTAAEKAAKEAAEKDAARKAAAEKEAAKKKAAAEKDAAKKDSGDKTTKDPGHKDKQHDAWWPEHVWAHPQSCGAVDLDAGTVAGTWHVWLKYGGAWDYVGASPKPSNVANHGDKVRLDYSATAQVVKTHDGWSKAKAGPVNVTVNGPDGKSKTFPVDLWVKVGADGTCHL